MLLLAALIATSVWVAAALLIVRQVSAASKTASADAAQARRLHLVALFAPAVAAASDDPSAVTDWQPVAALARAIAPDDVEAVERSRGASFPFSSEQIQDAHARWSADWLSWEVAHDAEYKMKAAAVQQESAASGGSPAVRSHLDAIEREKLQRYQQRYTEYTKVSKALQALIASASKR